MNRVALGDFTGTGPNLQWGCSLQQVGVLSRNHVRQMSLFLSSELHRCAVFCLLQLGGEIFDTDMVMVDRTLTDICFDNTIVL